MSLQQDRADLTDVACLRLRESGGREERGELLFGEGQHLLGRARPVEERRGHANGHFVARAHANHGGHKQLEGARVSPVAQLEERRAGQAGAVDPQSPKELVNVEGLLGQAIGAGAFHGPGRQRLIHTLPECTHHAMPTGDAYSTWRWMPPKSWRRRWSRSGSR